MIATVAAGVLGVLAVLAQAEPYKIGNAWNYVFAGWIVTVVGLAAYALLVVRRGRRLARQLPPEERRWMS